MKPDDATTYHVTLRPEPGRHNAPPIQRLRAALKTLLRRYGLRCVVIKPLTETIDTTERAHNE